VDHSKFVITKNCKTLRGSPVAFKLLLITSKVHMRHARVDFTLVARSCPPCIEVGLRAGQPERPKSITIVIISFHVVHVWHIIHQFFRRLIIFLTIHVP